jgi:hypothetical protein
LEGTVKTALEALVAEAERLQAEAVLEGKELPFGEAIEQVSQERPDLARLYRNAAHREY